MKKNLFKTILVSSLFASTLAIVGVGANAVQASAAEETVKPFTNVIGASVRISDPDGIRFKVKLTDEKKAEVFAENSNKTLGIRIFPASYVGDKTDVDDIVEGKTVLDIPFTEADLYQADGAWLANGVMSNMYLQSFNREFVGIGYIATVSGETTTYEYADIALADATRSIADVSFAYYEDSADEKALPLLEKAIYSAYGITETREEGVASFAKDTSAWASYDDVKADNAITLNAGEALSLNGGATAKLAPKFAVNGTDVTLNNQIGFTYTSSKDSVATVAADGTITAVGNGSATITVSYADYTATCTVSVAAPYELQEGEVMLNDCKQLSDLTWVQTWATKSVETNGIRLTASSAAAWADIRFSLIEEGKTLTYDDLLKFEKIKVVIDVQNETAIGMLLDGGGDFVTLSEGRNEVFFTKARIEANYAKGEDTYGASGFAFNLKTLAEGDYITFCAIVGYYPADYDPDADPNKVTLNSFEAASDVGWIQFGSAKTVESNGVKVTATAARTWSRMCFPLKKDGVVLTADQLAEFERIEITIEASYSSRVGLLNDPGSGLVTFAANDKTVLVFTKEAVVQYGQYDTGNGISLNLAAIEADQSITFCEIVGYYPETTEEA